MGKEKNKLIDNGSLNSADLNKNLDDRLIRKHLSFLEKFEVLTAYKNDKQRGNGTIANITTKEKYVYNGKEYQIGSWMAVFRGSYSGRIELVLTEQQIEALESLGMMWSMSNVINFETKFKVLNAYKNDTKGGNGTIANISQREKYLYDGVEYPIGVWIGMFRQAKKGTNTYSITNAQVEQLNSLGMVWDANTKISFETKLEVLTAYTNDINGGNGTLINTNQHTTYVYNGVEYPIGAWLCRFRDAYRGIGTSKINAKQIEQLKSLGMTFDKNVIFAKKIQILTAYKNDVNGGNGTIANILSKETYEYNGTEYPIGVWILKFRMEYKSKQKMDLEKIIALDDLGMVWQVYNVKTALHL